MIERWARRAMDHSRTRAQSQRAAGTDPANESSSRDDLFDGLTVVDIEPLATGDFQLARIEAKLLEKRGMNIGYIVAVFNGMEANLIGCPVYDAAFDAASGQPNAKSKDVMVASIRTL